jgi:hypothetical protein
MGAAPSVDIATTTGDRLTIEPNWNWQKAGLSMTFTGTPAAWAASKKARASPSSPQSAMAIAAPATIDASHACGW